MRYIITGIYEGKKITRVCYSDLQAFIINNTLAREGVENLGMREEAGTNDNRAEN